MSYRSETLPSAVSDESDFRPDMSPFFYYIAILVQCSARGINEVFPCFVTLAQELGLQTALPGAHQIRGAIYSSRRRSAVHSTGAANVRYWHLSDQVALPVQGLGEANC